MDFPVTLLSVLLGTDSGNGVAVDPDLAGFAVTRLNDSVEASFGVAPNAELLDPDILPKSKEVAALLQSLILACIMSEETPRETATEEDAETNTKSTIERITESDLLQVEEDAEMKNLAELLRACKNLLRWYLQVFLQVKEPVLPPPLSRLQSHAMIELYVLIIQRTAGEPENDPRQQVARHACLCLFYSTYSPSGNEGHIQRAQTHLVESLGFLETLIGLLVQNNSTEVLVSLVRVVHNLLGSLEGMVKRVEETQIPSVASNAPWAPQEGEEINLQSLLTDIILWAVQSTPAFPGEANDRRSDLVMEILRIFYVLRVGRYVQSDPSISNLIAYFLKLPNTEERAYRCKLAAISLLMDAPGEYSEQLVQQKGIMPLLTVMDNQVSQVVGLTEVGPGAASAVVPILSVINKFCIHSDTFREKTKFFIFPHDAEERFILLVEEVGDTKNMQPLDAPRGTLRFKLITLMSWTESHIKRTAGELLWTLCDQNSQEFIWRTGLGNAVPILSAKGLLDISSGITS